MDEKIIDHLIGWVNGKTIGPYEAELRITRICNLKCFHCPGHDEGIIYGELLDLDSWLKAIKECANLGVRECFLFAEGEPMTSKFALHMMKEIKKQGMRGKTVTNGTLFNKKNVKEIVDIGWDQIYISMDAPDAEGQDYVRGKGVFNRIIESIKIINEEKDKQGKSKPELLFNTVLSNLNYYKLKEMVILAKDQKISNIIFHPLNLWTSKANDLEISPKQSELMHKHIPDAIKLCDKYEIHHNLDTYYEQGWEKGWKKKKEVRKETKKVGEKSKRKNPLNPFFSVPCYLPWYFISIMEDGRVNPCHSIHTGKENLKNKSLKEIWFGSYFNSIRDQLLCKKIHPDCFEKCCAMQATEHKPLREALINRHRKNEN